jgi:outer membrane biosynthesis protein TonB
VSTQAAATPQTVSEILELRSATEGGFSRVVTGSLVVHVIGVASLFLAHQYLASHPAPKPVVMTISLGSGSGPRSTGMTSAGARPVDQVAEPKRNEVVKPAASTSNTMTLPVKSTPKPAKVEETLPVTSTPKPATTGREITKGTSLAETGSKSQDTGLSIGGAGVKNVGLEITDFCCPDYVAGMAERIQRNWNKNVSGRGVVILKFVIHRDGTITNVQTEEATNSYLENNSRSALALAKLAPLPAEFKSDTLVVHLRFPYGID